MSDDIIGRKIGKVIVARITAISDGDAGPSELEGSQINTTLSETPGERCIL
jgi:hypothetical protein